MKRYRLLQFLLRVHPRTLSIGRQRTYTHNFVAERNGHVRFGFLDAHSVKLCRQIFVSRMLRFVVGF